MEYLTSGYTPKKSGEERLAMAAWVIEPLRDYIKWQLCRRGSRRYPKFTNTPYGSKKEIIQAGEIARELIFAEASCSPSGWEDTINELGLGDVEGMRSKLKSATTKELKRWYGLICGYETACDTLKMENCGQKK